MSHGIETSRHEEAWVVRINRPDRRNALSGDTWTAFRDAVLAAPTDARAIIVTGSERTFSAGMDLKLDNPLLPRVGGLVAAQDADGLRALIQELKACLAPLRAARVPTIAAIEGHCLGAGLEIALHCDVRIASDSAIFSMPEPRLGFVADVGGTTLLRRLVGPGRASWLIASGRTIDTAMALQWGLVEERCDRGYALTHAHRFAHDAAHGGPVSTAASLRLLRDDPADLAPALHRETEAGVEALLAGEVVEALAASAEHRTPAWMHKR